MARPFLLMTANPITASLEAPPPGANNRSFSICFICHIFHQDSFLSLSLFISCLCLRVNAPSACDYLF